MNELKKETLPLKLTGGNEIKKVNLLGALREVFPKMIFLDYLSELSVIEVPSGCWIERHRHTDDSEWWVKLSKNGIKVSHCRNGGDHELPINDTGGVMYIIAIKCMVPKKKPNNR